MFWSNFSIIRARVDGDIMLVNKTFNSDIVTASCRMLREKKRRFSNVWLPEVMTQFY